MNQIGTQEGDIERCVNCGKCRAVCPVSRVLPLEKSSARGKVMTMKGLRDGFIRPGSETESILDLCLLCGSCRVNCPLNVEVEEAVIRWRGGVGKRSVSNRALEKVLSSPDRMKISSDLAKLLLPIFFKRWEDNLYRIRRGISPPFIPSDLFLKKAEKGLSEMLQKSGFSNDGKYRATGTSKGDRVISFFYGCLINHIYPEIGVAVVGIFRNAGVPITIPTEQVCCGMPLLSLGDIDGARETFAKNLPLFHDSDVVVTVCATCGSTLKRIMPRLFKGDEREKEVRAFSNKIVDFSELFFPPYDILPLPKMATSIMPEFSLHYPCHLTRGMGVKAEMSMIVKSLAPSSYRPSPLEEFCCGFGGTFYFKNPELSRRIRNYKLDSYGDVRYIITACPGCIMSLTSGLRGRGKETEVIHIAEFMNLFNPS